MLTISVLRNAAAAARYYSAPDAAVEGLELPSPQWHGQGAAMLGLSGQVDPGDFRRMLDGVHDGQRLRQERKNGRCGYDFTLSVPKSVSILATVGGDERIVTAVSEAADEAMRAVEDEASIWGKPPKQTGNLCWADFLHATGRPVKGRVDPQLHVHLVAGNFTRADKWRAMEVDPLFQQSAFVTTAFRNSLAFKMRELGYEIAPSKHGFEVEGVPSRAIKEFSSRTGLIEKVAEALGEITAKVKGKLGATTREKKTPPVDWDDLQGQWRARMKPADLEMLHQTVEASKEREITPRDEKVAAWAMRRKPNLSEKKRLAWAMDRNLGEVTLHGLHKQMAHPKPKADGKRLSRRLYLTRCIERAVGHERQPTLGVG